MAELTLKDKIKATDEDTLIDTYIGKAKTLIKYYLNCDDTVVIDTTYPDAVMEYVSICLNKHGNEGMKQFTQGSRSGTYGNDLPDSVKALLPLPFATLK